MKEKKCQATSKVGINDHNIIIVIVVWTALHMEKGNWEFYLQRKKATLRCLAEMFGCRAGTLRKSRLFSYSPPNKRLQYIQTGSREVRKQWL